jgi:general secretion pathway protein D
MSLQRLATFILLLAIACVQPVRAAESSLQSVHTEVADDGSVGITLTFNGEVPDVRVIHAAGPYVHVVFIGANLGGKKHAPIARGGEILGGAFSTFVGIGFRLDLAMRSMVNVTTETIGASAVVIHVPAAHSDVEETLSREQPNNDAVQIAYVPLNYADVSEVAGILVKDASVPSLDGFTPQSPFAAPTPNSSMSSSSSGVNPKTPTYVTIPTAAIMTKDTPQGKWLDDHVAIDRRLNAIILSGTPEQIAHYKRIIAYVDIPEPSILLETEVVELTESAANDLGIDYSPNNSILATGSLGISSGNKGVLSGSMNATLSALIDNGSAKLLARPRILTVDGRTAAILSGEAVPIVSAIIVPGSGGNIIENQVQYINVGVSLQILPRVSSDGRVSAQIFSEVSSIIGYVGNVPSIAVRQALASAIVNDGQSLIIGGLMQQNEITDMRKVPGLGDIPLIGAFFRENTTTATTTNLYIVITPHVLSMKTFK